MNLELVTISDYVRIEAGIKKLFADKPLYSSLCGVRPSLTPAEIISIEVLGERQGFWGTQAIWRYADQHWRHFFPNLPSYKSFARLCSHTTGIKLALWHLLFPRTQEIHILDGVPIPVCKMIRAKNSRIMHDKCAFGFCVAKNERYFGLRAQVVINLKGHIIDFIPAPANIDERVVATDLIGTINCDIIADKGYIGEEWKKTMAENGIIVHTPMRSNMVETRDEEELRWQKRTRKKIETVIGQLTETFGITKNTAHVEHSWLSQLYRKILTYNLTKTGKI